MLLELQAACWIGIINFIYWFDKTVIDFGSTEFPQTKIDTYDEADFNESGKPVPITVD